MDYDELTLEIRSASKKRFNVRAQLQRQAAHERGGFGLPLDSRELGGLNALAGAAAAGGSPEEESAGEGNGASAAERPLTAREAGERLERALFRDKPGSLLERGLAALHSDRQAGLRLRLLFDPSDPQSGYLQALPWELVRDVVGNVFRAQDRRTPLVRDLVTGIFAEPLETALPLRVLLVGASPEGLPKLDLEAERKRIGEALCKLTGDGRVEILEPVRPTLAATRRALLDLEPHVLHFMGHSSFDASTGGGAIYFEDDDGRDDEVEAVMLADFLRGLPALRLVVLNSCKTARGGAVGEPGHVGVASTLIVYTGLPAVVAMQHSVSDEAAIAYSRTFYEALAAGDPVDAAITEARLALGRKTSEWATPVLYMRSPDGVLFRLAKPDLEAAPARAVRGAEPAAQAPAVLVHDRPPLRLGIRSIVDFGREMESECGEENLLRLEEHFEGRRIRDEAAWNGAILPALREFLRRRCEPGRRIVLDFAAHQSIAFAAGWVLETKSGIDVAVRQRTAGKSFEWTPEEGEAPDDRLWLDEADVEVKAGAADVALAVSISREAMPAVEAHFEDAERPVSRIINARIAPEPAFDAVAGGRHALRLAQRLANRASRRYPHERTGTLRIFASAPNAFLFYLGQLSRGFGRVQLYEYPEFGSGVAVGTYLRSISLPPGD